MRGFARRLPLTRERVAAIGLGLNIISWGHKTLFVALEEIGYDRMTMVSFAI